MFPLLMFSIVIYIYTTGTFKSLNYVSIYYLLLLKESINYIATLTKIHQDTL